MLRCQWGKQTKKMQVECSALSTLVCFRVSCRVYKQSLRFADGYDADNRNRLLIDVSSAFNMPASFWIKFFDGPNEVNIFSSSGMTFCKKFCWTRNRVCVWGSFVRNGWDCSQGLRVPANIFFSVLKMHAKILAIIVAIDNCLIYWEESAVWDVFASLYRGFNNR